MPLGTLDRTPPPFFRQGIPATTKLVFCTVLALFLMVADTRLAVVVPLRVGLATLLAYPQRALQVPMALLSVSDDYLRGLTRALQREDSARRQLALQAERAAQAERLATENARLRELLALRPALTVRTLAAEVQYEAADPYSRKVFIDRGQAHGVAAGAPVINEAGVLGQVTRAYPLNAEVTLLTDKDAAIPVLNTRTQQRGAAYGGLASGSAMELRFLAANADVRIGDLLQTSGVDGVYPAGLAVARVTHIDRQAEGGFARVTLAPAATADGVRHVLVLEPLAAQSPPPPQAEATPAPRRNVKGRKP